MIHHKHIRGHPRLPQLQSQLLLHGIEQREKSPRLAIGARRRKGSARIIRARILQREVVSAGEACLIHNARTRTARRRFARIPGRRPQPRTAVCNQLFKPEAL